MVSFSRFALRRLGPLCTVLCFVVLVASVRADDLPAFDSPQMNALVREYNDLVELNASYMKNYMAGVRANDQAKWEPAMNSSNALQGKKGELYSSMLQLREKLSSEGQKKYDDFIKSCEKKMDDASK